MNLQQTLLLNLLSHYDLQVTFPGLEGSLSALAESQAVKALSQIQAVLRDDTLDDPECFHRIEAIVSLLEDSGMDCGNRHDWG